MSDDLQSIVAAALGLPRSAVPGQSIIGKLPDLLVEGTPGDDALQGPPGSGRATLLGGAGDDTYHLARGYDMVIERAGEGVDTIISTALSVILPEEVENLVLLGDRAYGGGNALANRIEGNDHAQVLNGGGGNDLLTGGGGADQFQMLAGGGWDVITDFQPGEDRLHLAAFPGFGTPEAVLAALRQDGADLHLDLGGGQGVTLLGVDRAALSAADIMLPPDVAMLTLTFAEEFDSFTWSADGSQGWRTTYSGNGRTLSSNGERQYYSDASVGVDPFRLEDGALVISAAPGGNPLGLPFTSGLITTQGSFAQLYGYFEARMQLPAGLGWWPAFWMLPVDLSWPPEIDVLESFGRGDGTVSFTVHTNIGATRDSISLPVAFDGTGGYHTYGVSWLPDQIRWYLDGVEVASAPTPADVSQPMYLLLNLAVTSLADTAGPGAELRIDHVRAYAYAPETIAAHVDTRDTLVSDVDAVLPDGMHNLRLSGSADLTGTGNALDNRLYAGLGHTLLLGLEGRDYLIGGPGHDTLDGGSGADRMIGMGGDDTYIVDSTSDVVVERAGEGTDLVRSSVSYTLGNAVEYLTLTGMAVIGGTGNALDNRMTANAAGSRLFALGGADTLIGGAGNDTLDGGTGADLMAGGAGDDSYVVDDPGDQVVELAGEGNDVVTASLSWTLGAHLERLVLAGTADLAGTGNELDNRIFGNAGANTLDGGAGHDSLHGGAGADLMIGGTGNDTFSVDDAADRVVELPGEGIDLVSASLSWVLGAELEKLTLTGTADLTGTGNELDNTLTGNAGRNRLEGLAGHDWLDGGAGADTLIGGPGNDTYVVDDPSDLIVELPGEGTDLVRSSISYALGAALENLTLIGTAAIEGTGNALSNRLTANAAGSRLLGLEGNDTLTGGAGADWLEGGTGADSMTGGGGDDTYVVDDPGDRVVEAAGGGHDTVRSSLSYILGTQLEALVLTGTADLTGTGNALDNILTGNAGRNRLEGLAGYDWLDGGAGADTLIGGLGDDTYVIDDPQDLIVEQPGEGTDLVRSAISYTLGAALENLTLTGTAAIEGTGNALDNRLTANAAGSRLLGLEGNDTLTGGAGADWLEGGTGADLMAGGAGDDSYVVDDPGDQVVELAGEGNDGVTASLSWTLGAHLEWLVLAGTAGLAGTGNELANRMTGNAGRNRLEGLAGDDWLDGGAGADTLIGGLGDDTYVIDDPQDLVVEQLGEGTDLVRSAISYTLGAAVENLTLIGMAAIGGTGNALDNRMTANAAGSRLFALGGADTLIGGAGNDTLDGGTGADLMAGGAGDDSYVVDDPGDQVVELAGEGNDVVTASLSWTLGAHLERLVLAGTADLAGTGNELDNRMIGNAGRNRLEGLAGDDWLDGGAGADTLIGGLGDDTYVVDDPSDLVVELPGEGLDSVQSSVTFTLGVALENLRLTGTAPIAGTGNELDNRIIGNAAANTLDGGAGNDWLDGGAGADWLIGGTGDDTFAFAPGCGADTVADFGLGRDRLDLRGFQAQLSDLVITPTGGDILLQFAGGDSILLKGVTSVTLQGDYVLA
ncbi:family 16 glycosylhydrolase [Roseicella aerolata]|uniref:Family 16 glycosylhydrolase n=1 Tax=Roseicella aerolata TaxID=2883479 RepID=A0A9X1L9M6_9PROT|nr:family 16 glycosylhydrolase [Roseicella aerolata]MCB4821290.1 family 16 glycosylhydrolase [Roseicella aerolata]